MMINSSTKALMISCLLIISLNVQADMMLFSTSKQPFVNNHSDQKPCYLDLKHKVQRKLNKALRGQHHINKATIKKRYKQQIQSMSHAYVCQIKAKHLGVKHLPAIVFNHHYVVYGTTDVGKAQQWYRDYKERHS